MALTDLQRQVCQLIAGNQIASGESSVAGAAALEAALQRAQIRFHEGCIRGALPEPRDAPGDVEATGD
jgi:hypothetical protein